MSMITLCCKRYFVPHNNYSQITFRSIKDGAFLSWRAVYEVNHHTSNNVKNGVDFSQVFILGIYMYQRSRLLRHNALGGIIQFNSSEEVFVTLVDVQKPKNSKILKILVRSINQLSSFPTLSI